MYVSVILLMLKLESSTRYVKLWITSFLWLCGLFVMCLTVCIQYVLDYSTPWHLWFPVSELAPL